MAASISSAEDWPQWRFDSGRTGMSPQQLKLDGQQRLWSRALPPLTPAFRDVRLQFDRGYEPVVVGKRLFVGSSRDDSLIAMDTETGELLWRFVSGGPVRFAPVASQDRVYFGSDDGYFYCLDAADGTLRWKFQAVPSERLLFGNRRLISTWPVRGGPVLHDGRVYFAAGVWSFEGVFVYALDAGSGDVLWMNDQCSYLYGVHPHNAVAFGGLAPQGYLLVNGGELVVPSSAAYPARLDLQTGELVDFQLPADGRRPGGWFVATGGDPGGSKLGLLPGSEVARKRDLLFERAVNQKRHEDQLREEGQPGVGTAVWAGKERLSFGDALPGVDGTVHSLLVADDKLFVVTVEGEIVCFGTQAPDRAVRHTEAPRVVDAADEGAQRLLAASGAKHGLAIVLGLPELAVVETMASASDLQLVVIESSAERVQAGRSSLIASGLYGHRVAIREGAPDGCELPPFLAELIVSWQPLPPASLERLSNSVRPFGGKLIVPRLEVVGDADFPGFRHEFAGEFSILTRTSLPGSTNYTGGWNESADTLVSAPLGVLWFDDALGHFKRSPQPKFVDGVMVSVDKLWTDASTRSEKGDYRLSPPVFSDVYTGRILTEEETPLLSESITGVDLQTIQPSQYRPPRQQDAWKPEQPQAGVRKNPLTGVEEPRAFPKSYGCDGGVDYGNFYTLRSGTAAFYDKRIESGTINLSGPRSGCTNSIIPANGVLNVPYFYEGCTCSYPLPTAMALISMPKTHEQWASWGEVAAESLQGKIHRVGINFGAPGDRMTEEGTLWLDFPNVGGPSPQVRVEVEPADQLRYRYRHSLWVENPSADAWPWVAASAVVGAKEIRIHGLMAGSYEATLFFAELEGVAARRFGVAVGGVAADVSFAPSPGAGSRLRAFTQSLPAVRISDDGILRVQLSPESGETSLSGIELIRRDGN